VKAWPRRGSSARRAWRWAGRLVLVTAVVAWAASSVRAFWDTPGYDLSALVVGAKVMHDGAVGHLYDHNARYYNIADSPEFEQAAHELGFVGYAPTAFVHPPLLASLAAPLAATPFRTTAHAWLLASLVATIAGAWLAFRAYAPRWATAWHLAAVFACISWFEPVRYALWLGQTTPFVFLDVVGAAVLLRTRKDAAAGLVLSLSVFLKLTPIVLVASWAWQRRWRAVAAALGGLLALALLSAAIDGIAPNVEYLRRVHQISGITLITFNDDSLPALLTRWTFRQPDVVAFTMIPPPAWVRWAVVAGTALVAILAVRCDRVRPDGQLLDALGMLAMLLVPSIAWTHYFVFLAPVALVVCTRVPRGALRVACVVACLVVLASCCRPWITDQTDFDPLHPGSFTTPAWAALALVALACGVGLWRSGLRQRPRGGRPVVQVVS
jgi:hypothetical protein